MKKLLLYSVALILCILAIIILLKTCSPEISITKPNEYIQGKVVYMATSHNKNGIVRAFINEGDRDMKLLRGFVYSDDHNPSFDLFEIVFFQVIEDNGIQRAIKMTNTLPSGGELIKLADYAINLHPEADHDYAAHSKIHIISAETKGNLKELTVYNIDATPPSPFTLSILADDYEQVDTTLDYWVNRYNMVNGTLIYKLNLHHTHGVN